MPRGRRHNFFSISPLVCSTPGQGKFPTGLYPGWRDQQAEAHWTPDSPVPSDLTLYLSFSLTEGTSGQTVCCVLSWKKTNNAIIVFRLFLHILIKLWCKMKHCIEIIPFLTQFDFITKYTYSVILLLFSVSKQE